MEEKNLLPLPPPTQLPIPSKNMMTGPGFTEAMMHQVNRQLESSFFFSQSVELMDLLLIAFYDKLRTDIHDRCDSWLATEDDIVLGASFHHHIDHVLLSSRITTGNNTNNTRADSSGISVASIPKEWFKQPAQLYIQFCENEVNFIHQIKEQEKDLLKQFTKVSALNDSVSTDQSFSCLIKLLCTIIKEIRGKYKDLAVLFPPSATARAVHDRVMNNLIGEYDKAAVILILKLNWHLRRLLMQNLRLAVNITRILEFLKVNQAISSDTKEETSVNRKEILPEGTFSVFKHFTPPKFDPKNFRQGSAATRELILTGRTASCPIDDFITGYFTVHQIYEGHVVDDNLLKSAPGKSSISPVPLLLLWPLLQPILILARLFEPRILDELNRPDKTTAAFAPSVANKPKELTTTDENAIKEENFRLLSAIIFRWPSSLLGECITNGKHRDYLSVSWPPEFCIIGTSNSIPILSADDTAAKPHLSKSHLTRIYESQFCSPKHGFESLYRNIALNVKHCLTQKNAMLCVKLFELLADVCATMRSDACAVLDYNEDSFVCTLEYLKSLKQRITLPSPLLPRSPEQHPEVTTTMTTAAATITPLTTMCLHPRVYLETPIDTLNAIEMEEDDMLSNEVRLSMIMISMNGHRLARGEPILSIVENAIEEKDGCKRIKNEEVNGGDGGDSSEITTQAPSANTRSSARQRNKRKRDETEPVVSSSEENSTATTTADEPAADGEIKLPDPKRPKTDKPTTANTPLPARERAKRRQPSRNG